MDDLNIQTSEQGSTLPPLPGSDPVSIAKNSFHGFYHVGSRDYWKHNTTSLNKLMDKPQCQHYFIPENTLEVRCQVCYVGYAGTDVTARDGKLFLKDEEVIF